MEYVYTFGWDRSFYKCTQSAGGLVVFIPPKAKPPKLCEHAQAHTVFKRYHYNRVQKKKKERIEMLTREISAGEKLSGCSTCGSATHLFLVVFFSLKSLKDDGKLK